MIFVAAFAIVAFGIWFITGGRIEGCENGYTLVTHPWNTGEPKTCNQVKQAERVCAQKQSFREGLVMGLVFGVPAVFIFMWITYGTETFTFLLKVFIFCAVVAGVIVVIQQVYFADHPITLLQENLTSKAIDLVASCE